MFEQNIEGLNKHREQTIRDIKDLLQNNKRVACVRYTGYGKSYYIVRRMIEDVSGKVIIVVPNDTLKIHYEEQYKDNDKVIILTYQIIKNKTTDYIQQNYKGVSLIIADECHHITATKWTKEFQRLEKETNANVLGLTATPEKIKDISVVDTFFNGVQVEPLNLLDGISLGFVPKIKYIVAYTSLDDKQDIIDNKMTEVDRYKISNLLNVENIIGKYITKEYLEDNLKILVFVSRIEYIEEARAKVYNWFNSLYKDKNINIYSIGSSKSVKENENQLNSFKYNSSKNSIDIMISVDKLIEGLHLPSVSIAIALRKTKSTRVYFQQLGRIINDKQPIFFDLINNISHLYQIKKEYESDIDKCRLNISDNCGKVMFNECVELIDETKEIIQILCMYSSCCGIDYITNLTNIIKENIDFIKLNSGKMTYKELFNKLGVHCSHRVFNNICRKLNITFQNNIGKTTKIVMENLDYIKENPENLSKAQLAKKFGITESGFNNVIRRNNIIINYITRDNMKYIKEKELIDNNIDNILSELNNGNSINNLSRLYNIPSSIFANYLRTKYNYFKIKKLDLDLDYIINNPDNLTISQLALKFGYTTKSGSYALKNRLIRLGIMKIKYKDSFIILNPSLDDYTLNTLKKNKEYIIKELKVKSKRQLAEEFKIDVTKFKLGLYALKFPNINTTDRDTDISIFIRNHYDFIQDNCRYYTRNNIAVILQKMCNFKYSRSGIAGQLSKLGLTFKAK